MTPETFLALILFLPLCGTVLARLAPNKVAGYIATGFSLLSFVSALFIVNGVFAGTSLALVLGTWFSVAPLEVTLSFIMNPVSMLMTLIITGIGTLIHAFAIGYMEGDARQNRFFSYLNLFIFFMLVLVLGGSLPITFIGWEGVGLCSYLLIAFWFENDNFAKAGKKAFIVNRIGDLGLLMAMFLLVAHGQRLDVAAYAGQVPTMSHEIFGLPFWEVVAFCLLLGAIGKSAQVPLFVWLPDAMAGPTPVSALIHAATMVTAGIFLVIQYGAIFDAAPVVTQIMGYLGALTALLGALIALAKADIKKVLAYSTVSQLGLIFLGLAAGTEVGALFHVLTHAFFKACLFLGAGAVIVGCHHEQDIRKMGGLMKLMPITAVTFLMASLTAAGVPPFGAFFSKGMIVEATHHVTAWFVVAEVVSVFTAIYMTRLFCTVFLGKYRGEHAPHEVQPLLKVPLVVLAIGAISIGLVLQGGVPLASLLSLRNGPAEPLHLVQDLVSAWPGILGILVGYAFWTFAHGAGRVDRSESRNFSLIGAMTKPLEAGFYVNTVYDWIIVRPLRALAAFCSSVIEAVIDGFAQLAVLVTGFANVLLQKGHNGQIRLYGLLVLIGTGVALVLVG